MQPDFLEDFPLFYFRKFSFTFFNVFLRFFENSKKRDFLRFFERLHTFSRTTCVNTVQGHPRSLLLVPVDSTHMRIFINAWSIVTLALSCTFSQIRRLTGWKWPFYYLISFGASGGMTPFEFLNKCWHWANCSDV